VINLRKSAVATGCTVAALSGIGVFALSATAQSRPDVRNKHMMIAQRPEQPATSTRQIIYRPVKKKLIAAVNRQGQVVRPLSKARAGEIKRAAHSRRSHAAGATISVSTAISNALQDSPWGPSSVTGESMGTMGTATPADSGKLVWMVSLQPDQAVYPPSNGPSGFASPPPSNVFIVFIDATTGQFVVAAQDSTSSADAP
jgi:hypothetical protein